MKNFSSHGGIGGDGCDGGSFTLLYWDEVEVCASIALSTANMRKMKMSGESTCSSVALLLRHESSAFFLNSAVYCCNTRGKPLRVAATVVVLILLFC